MDWNLLLTIGGYLLGMGVIYGTLKAKIENVDKQQSCIDKRMDNIEERHNAAIDGIRSEVRGINDTLNQLVGKIDMFFTLYNKETNNHE